MVWDRRHSICRGSEDRESNIAREMARSWEKPKQTKPNPSCCPASIFSVPYTYCISEIGLAFLN